MRQLARPLVVIFALVVVGSGCSHLIKPTNPSMPLVGGEATDNIAFAGQNVTVRQPGLPLTDTRSWLIEVENYTARQLNLLLATDPTAELADTVVSFDLAGRSAIQVGQWKEMTITISTRLPNGRVIRTEPVTGNIDSAFENIAGTGAEVGGYALDATASIATFVWFFTQNDYACYGAVAALAAGLCLNISQPGIRSLIAQSEERRWSDLYAEVLRNHADDLRTGLNMPAPPPKKAITPRAVPTPKQPDPRRVVPPPPDPVEPPPPLLDPAD